MTEPGPRKGLWELMGQKRSSEEAPPTPPASSETSSPTPSAEDVPASPPVASPLDLSEQVPDTKPRGRSLWQVMQHAAAPADSSPMSPEATLAETVSPNTPPASPSIPAKKIDRRLQQMATREVDVADDADVPLEIADESEPGSERGEIASTAASVVPETLPGLTDVASPLMPAQVQSGLSRPAFWSVILGALSLPLSVIAIYPALWSRIPPSVSGFAALMLGFLAHSEIQRTRHVKKGMNLAYAGIGMGLLGMFAGPAIYSPLDIYGRACNAYTQGHLQQIGLGTSAYTQQYQTFPSGGIFRATKQGNPEPMHGWMTLLLPYLPESAVATQIDLTKPYSDPANAAAMGQLIPSFMAAGGDTTLIEGRYGPAHFAGVGGTMRLADGSLAHAGALDMNSQITRDEIIDGASNTLFAGEVASKLPAWGHPRNWRSIGRGLNRDPEGFGNARNSGALFLMADGSVRYLSNQTDPKVLQSLSTRDGEEKP